MFLYALIVIVLTVCVIHQRHRIPFNVRPSVMLIILLVVLGMFLPMVIPFILLGYYLGRPKTWGK
jgi:hypothetical protein